MPSSESDDRDFTDRFHDFLDGLGLADLTPDYREERDAANEAIDAAFDPLPEELAEDPDIAEVDRVNVHDDGGDVLVPVTTALFEAPGEPDLDRVWTFVGDLLAAVHPVFADEHVRHYDCQFAYADEDEESVIYRRVTVQPALVERYLDDPGFDLADLRAAVAEGDDGDDGVPPVNWKQFDAESTGSGSYAGANAAIAASAASASAGAAASCAGAAGAGAAGGAGGCGGA